MYYIIGDIHGKIKKLRILFKKINNVLNYDDTIIFLGDYIDRGFNSKDVIEYLLYLNDHYNVIFLKGNHEDMFKMYLNGEIEEHIYFYNGGDMTIKSYEDNKGNFLLPKKHRQFFDNLKYYYETNDFIAVHAGVPSNIKNLENADEKDLIWIRDLFFRSDAFYEKTIIFGHTITSVLNTDNSFSVYFDKTRNIIGIDTGAAYGGNLTCLRWPDLEVFQS